MISDRKRPITVDILDKLVHLSVLFVHSVLSVVYLEQLSCLLFLLH